MRNNRRTLVFIDQLRVIISAENSRKTHKLGLLLLRLLFSAILGGYKNCKLPNCLGRLLSGPSGLALQLFKLIAAAPAPATTRRIRNLNCTQMGEDFRILYEASRRRRLLSCKPKIELASQQKKMMGLLAGRWRNQIRKGASRSLAFCKDFL